MRLLVLVLVLMLLPSKRLCRVTIKAWLRWGRSCVRASQAGKQVCQFVSRRPNALLVRAPGLLQRVCSAAAGKRKATKHVRGSGAGRLLRSQGGGWAAAIGGQVQPREHATAVLLLLRRRRRRLVERLQVRRRALTSPHQICIRHARRSGQFDRCGKATSCSNSSGVAGRKAAQQAHHGQVTHSRPHIQKAVACHSCLVV